MTSRIARKMGILFGAGAVGLLLVAVLLHLGASSYAAGTGGSPVFRTGQVRGHWNGYGNGAAEFRVGGFTPGTTAYVALVGWSFDFEGVADHEIDQIGIWTQKAVQGGWQWSNEFPVNAAGVVYGQFYVMFNDENNDDRFEFLINFLVIGQ